MKRTALKRTAVERTAVVSLCLSTISANSILACVVVAAIVVAPFLGYFAWPYSECCTDRWDSPNVTGLQLALQTRVFGQHFVTNTVLKAVVGHLNNKSPSKALALSFNGWSGSGKNFVSQIIAEHLFRKGMDSKYVHRMIASYDFPHQSELDFYKRKLRAIVAGSVSECPRSLFIFDEMDKMPIGLIDALKPYLDYYSDVGKVDFRKSIFIFLSNTGAHLINAAVLKHWKEGKKREDLEIKKIDRLINLGEFNTKGGLWHSSLIDKNLIDFFVPFMPLERSHIKMCAKVELEQKGHLVIEEILNKVADQLEYFPEDSKLLSKNGCKQVSSKVNQII